MIKVFDNFYSNTSKIKWLITSLIILTIVFSTGYVNIIIDDIRERERNVIELYANSIEYLANSKSDINTDFLIQKIVIKNTSIPVIISDKNDHIIDSRNIIENNKYKENEKKEILENELIEMKSTNDPIKIFLKNEKDEIIDYQLVYYKNSKLLNKLSLFPYLQVCIIIILSIIFYLVFKYSNTAEKNKIWIGLAKETAHQLGTPLSSLIGWKEYIKSKHLLKSKPEIIKEIEKDLQKLSIITERFSSIGSKPVLKNLDIRILINKSISYLKKRCSSSIQFKIESSNDKIYYKINKELFGWAIENLCKNSIDALGKKGNILIKIHNNHKKLIIDIIDDGIGIKNGEFNNIFKPGVSTKSRGWGLGLSLVKRIIEEYHDGKIFVKKSIKNIETVIRIEMKKEN